MVIKTRMAIEKKESSRRISAPSRRQAVFDSPLIADNVGNHILDFRQSAQSAPEIPGHIAVAILRKEDAMKIFVSKNSDASHVSSSCEASMLMWYDCGGCEILRDDAEVKIICHSSHDKWNGRYGGEITWKHDGTVMLVHVTGSGFGWGTINSPAFSGNFILVPTKNEGGTVHQNIISLPDDWEEIAHPIFDGLDENPYILPVGLAPQRV